MRTLRCVMTEDWGAAGKKNVLKVWWCSQISTVAFFTTQTLPEVFQSVLCCVCMNLACPKSSFWKSPCGIQPMDVDVCLHPGRRCLFSLSSPPLAFPQNPPGSRPFPTCYTEEEEGPFCSLHSCHSNQLIVCFSASSALSHP